MDRNKKMLDFIVYLQKKYNKTNEILDLTQEMDKALQVDDHVSFEMLLAMREEVMKQVDRIDDTIKISLNEVSGDLRERVMRILSAKAESLGLVSCESKEEKKIVEIIGKTRRTLGRVIAIDKRMSTKIGGDDSYYM